MSRPLEYEQASTTDVPTPGARAALILLLLINLFNYIDRLVLAAVEPEIRHAFFPQAPNDAATLAKTGSLATAFLVSYMLAAPVLGFLAERMSRWILIGLSVIVWSLATGGCGLAGSFAVLVFMRCLVGIGEGGYGPSAPTIIADFYPVARRGAVLSWFYTAMPVGGALGYILGSQISAAYGWRVAFACVTPPGLILAIWCFFMRDPREIVPRADTHLPPGDTRWKEYAALLRNRSYVLDTFGMTAMTFAIGGMSFWMPSYLCDHRGLPTSARAIFGAITAAAGLAATLLGGIAGDRMRGRFPGSYFIVSAGGMFIACPFILAMLYMPFPYAWAPLFVGIFFLFFNTGPTNAILANVTVPASRATAFGLNILVLHLLGDAVAPPILGWFAGKFGWNGAFGLVVISMVAAGVLWLWGAKYLEEDTRAAGAHPS